MAEKNIALHQKMKLIAKLSEQGINGEKELLSMDIGRILSIPGINIQEVKFINELQSVVKTNKLFSYLCLEESKDQH